MLHQPVYLQSASFSHLGRYGSYEHTQDIWSHVHPWSSQHTLSLFLQGYPLSKHSWAFAAAERLAIAISVFEKRILLRRVLVTMLIRL